MSVPIRYLLKFLSAAEILMALWPPVTWIYGPLLGSATNAFFAFFQPGISLEVGEKTYFVCNLWPETVRSELKSFGSIYLNALVVIALFAGLPGRLRGRLKALGTALLALFATHVLCIYLLSHFAVWNALQSMNQTLQIKHGSFLPLSERIATALFHQKAMLCSKIMVLWGNFGWEGLPFLAGALFYIRSRGLLGEKSPGAERVSRPSFKRKRMRSALKKPTFPLRTGSPSPPASRLGSRAIRRNTLYSILIMLAFTSAAAQAQQVMETTPAQGISGENNVLPGNEIQIYVLHIEDTVNDVRSAQLGGTPPGSFGITVTISDVSGGGSGLAATDFIGLNLYRSDDATLDAGDTLMKTVAVSIVAATLIDMQGVAGGEKAIPDPGDVPPSIYFFVTADVSAGATPGHRFRLGAALDHADIRETGGGMPSSYGVGSAIAASDANVVIIISAGAGPPEVPRTIPLMPPYLYLVLAIITMAYGIFSLKVRH